MKASEQVRRKNVGDSGLSKKDPQDRENPGRAGAL
jgi:hypothetical protein